MTFAHARTRSHTYTHVSYLFYNTMLQSKGPPHVLDGKVFLTDLTAYYTQMIVYITILACCLYSFWSMTRVCLNVVQNLTLPIEERVLICQYWHISKIDILDTFDISNNHQRRESSRERAPENFLKKIGMNAKVADLRRNFVGKTRKHIEKVICRTVSWLQNVRINYLLTF